MDLAAQGEALGPDGGIAGLPSHRSGCSLWWQAAAPIVSTGLDDLMDPLVAEA